MRVKARAISVGMVAISLSLAGVAVYAATAVTAPTSLGYKVAPAHTTMQSFTAEDCRGMGNYETVELEDTRGNRKHYRVRKMPDGKCWMIDDLKLGGTGANLTLTPSDSNVTANFVLPANPVTTAANRVTNGICNSTVISASGTAGYLTCDGTTTVTGTDDNENYNFAAYADPSNTSNPYYENCSPGAPGVNADSLTGCGYLYNWYTATAGTGVHDTPADTTTNANVAPSSICPAGWHLPKAGTGSTTGNEFATLNGAMYNGGSAITTNNATTRANFRASGPFSGSYSGYWYSAFGSQGNDANYWSASAYSATSARYLYFNYSSVYPGSVSRSKYYGYSVRCAL